MPCPRCTAATTTELPKQTSMGYRTFRCQECRRAFNERTGTPFNYLEYPTDIVLLVVLHPETFDVHSPTRKDRRTRKSVGRTDG